MGGLERVVFAGWAFAGVGEWGSHHQVVACFGWFGSAHPHGAHRWVRSVSFSPDGRLLASGSEDNTIKLWRVADGSLVRTLTGLTGLTGHTWAVLSVSFSPDGRLLASGSEDNTIKLWRVADGALLQTYNQETFGAFSIQFSSDGRLFGYGRADATVVVARNPFWQSGEGNPQPKNVKPAM
jgi:WD40 repeat protein